MESEEHYLGRKGYAAYASVVDAPAAADVMTGLPKWEDLPPNVKNAWGAAAIAIRDEVRAWMPEPSK